MELLFNQASSRSANREGLTAHQKTTATIWNNLRYEAHIKLKGTFTRLVPAKCEIKSLNLHLQDMGGCGNGAG